MPRPVPPLIQVPNEVRINVSHQFRNNPTAQGLASGVSLAANRGDSVSMNVFGGLRARALIAAHLLSGRDMEENLEAADVSKALRMADAILAQEHREAEFRSRLWECRTAAEFTATAEAIHSEMAPYEQPSLQQWIKDFRQLRPELAD